MTDGYPEKKHVTVITPKNLVGPAMVAAYQMESKLAKFPRVIIDRCSLVLAHRAEN
jgi:hypothetical protein